MKYFSGNKNVQLYCHLQSRWNEMKIILFIYILYEYMPTSAIYYDCSWCLCKLKLLSKCKKSIQSYKLMRDIDFTWFLSYYSKVLDLFRTLWGWLSFSFFFIEPSINQVLLLGLNWHPSTYRICLYQDVVVYLNLHFNHILIWIIASKYAN